MSDEPAKFSGLDYLISAVTAFVVVAGGAVGVAMIATHGILNREGLGSACALGLVGAAKDFRSMRRLPPVKTNGNDSTPPFKL